MNAIPHELCSLSACISIHIYFFACLKANSCLCTECKTKKYKGVLVLAGVDLNFFIVDCLGLAAV